MLIKQYVLDDEDPQAPKIDGAAATRGIVRSLYESGRYEQWCLDYGKDKDVYWRSVFGDAYDVHKAAHPVEQAMREPPRRGLLARILRSAA